MTERGGVVFAERLMIALPPEQKAWELTGDPVTTPPISCTEAKTEKELFEIATAMPCEWRKPSQTAVDIDLSKK